MRIITKALLFALLFLAPFSVFSQRQANIWHFGFGNALDFSSGSPVPVSGSQQFTFEGCASYCDALGNLLFYTNGGGREPAFSGQDGGHIWNRNNAVMYDLQGIEGGGFSAQQSSVIFEAPGEDSVYYVFTMDEAEFDVGASAAIQASQPNGRGLSYFKVDMALNGGLGGVTLADQRLYAPSAEGLCAIRHANGVDYWVLMHRDSSGLGVYKVTSSGVTFSGTYTALGTSSGKIKASPTGTLIATNFAVLPNNTLHLLQFNNSTGVISNPIILSSNATDAEFSPNSLYLHTLEIALPGFQTITKQYSLQAANILASGVIFDTIPNLGASMQLGPDGNIYFLTVNPSNQMSLNRIVCPNTTAPALETNLLNFTGGVFFGLPNFPAWLFENNNSQYVSLGPDTLELCGTTTSFTLDARNPGMTYLWSTGETTQTIQVTQQGVYWAQVSGNCGIGTDTVFVRACELGSCLTFTYNGTNQPQTFTVPAGVDSISVKMWGGAGGSGPNSGDAIGGAGGYTQFSLSVTPGETFSISVGQGGKRSMGNQGGLGGWPGGGNGGTGTLFESPVGTPIPVGGAGGGGGATIFRRTSNNTIIAIAGGGGGAAYGRPGGNGGGLEAGYTIAQNALIFNQFGFGGTQTAGGAPAANTIVSNPVFGTAGSSLQGGTGATDIADAFRKAGGGGGAGWYGGGGGSSYDGSGFGVGSTGGGGSGYLCTTCPGLTGLMATADPLINVPPNFFLLTDIPGSAQNTTGFDGGNGFVNICYSLPCAPVQAQLTVQNCGPYAFAGATYSVSGVYTDTLNTANGCDSIVTLNLTINTLPTASPSTQPSQCTANTGSAAANASGGSGPYTYLWTPGNANTASVNSLAAGAYTVQVTDANGCTTTATTSVTQINGPSVAATPVASGCDNQSGSAFALATGGTPPYSYQWLPIGGNQAQADSLPSGGYFITITDGNGCTGQSTASVGILPGDQVLLDNSDLYLTEGDSVVLQASGVVQYSWFPSTYLSCTNCPNPLATATQDITYVVTGTDANGCVSTANVRIFVDIKCGEEFFPTVFSPDKRGPDTNETVCAYGNCIKEISYEIFNRWGQRVFKANSLAECWDGKINGANAEPGVYSIKAQYTLLNGTPKEYTGYLNLIR